MTAVEGAPAHLPLMHLLHPIGLQLRSNASIERLISNCKASRRAERAVWRAR